MTDLFYSDNLPRELTLEVPDGETLDLRVVSFHSISDHTLHIKVGSRASFVGAFADFSSASRKIAAEIELLGPGAKAEWHLASMGLDKSAKSYAINLHHNAINTTGLVSNYGIAKDASRLLFTGSSKIAHGSIGTQTRQEAKIIVFDPDADGIASPILEIDDNDVMASHAAVVGRINEQHLFYLRSRGLSLMDAKRLIAWGYLKPIERYFDDPALKERIDARIEEAFPNV